MKVNCINLNISGMKLLQNCWQIFLLIGNNCFQQSLTWKSTCCPWGLFHKREDISILLYPEAQSAVWNHWDPETCRVKQCKTSTSSNSRQDSKHLENPYNWLHLSSFWLFSMDHIVCVLIKLKEFAQVQSLPLKKPPLNCNEYCFIYNQPKLVLM